MAPDNRTLSYPYLGDPAKPHASPHSNVMRQLRAQYHGRISAEVATDDGKLTIPSTPEELTEALMDDDWRAKAFGDAESTKEVLASYNRMVNKADVISKQTAEAMESTLTKFLKDHGVTDLPTKAEIQKLIPEAKANGGKYAGVYNKFAPGAAADALDFQGLGHLAATVLKDGMATGQLNSEDRDRLNKLKDVSAAYSSTDPASAGFLIPEEMRASILQLALEQSVVRSRATTITLSSKTVDIPYVDVTSHASSLFGGMIFYWTEESGALTVEEATFGKVQLEANKLTGAARIPNELIQDAPALTSWLNRALPEGIAHYEDQAFVNGSGVGEPLGFLNSPALVQVTRATNDVIAIADIAEMYARMLPQSLGRGVWFASQTALPDLIQMTLSNDAIGLIGRDATGTPTMSLLGRPLVITEKMPAMANGSGNDIVFADLGFYLIGDRQVVSIDSSPHSRFLNDETELRVIERVDGRPWIQSALTPLNGTDTLTPFVGLAD